MCQVFLCPVGLNFVWIVSWLCPRLYSGFLGFLVAMESSCWGYKLCWNPTGGLFIPTRLACWTFSGFAQLCWEYDQFCRIHGAMLCPPSMFVKHSIYQGSCCWLLQQGGGAAFVLLLIDAWQQSCSRLCHASRCQHWVGVMATKVRLAGLVQLSASYTYTHAGHVPGRCTVNMHGGGGLLQPFICSSVSFVHQSAPGS